MPSNQSTKIFSERLSDLIAESGKNIKTLASEIGISMGALSSYQNDSKEASIGALSKIAKYFEVTTDYLLGLNKNKTVENIAIGNKIGLLDETIEILKVALLEKEKLKSDSKRYYFIDIINLLIEQMNIQPRFIERFEELLNFDFSCNEQDVEEMIYDEFASHPKFDELMSKTCILLGHDYQQFIERQLEIVFRAIISDIETLNNPSWFDKQVSARTKIHLYSDANNGQTYANNILRNIEYRQHVEKVKEKKVL